MSNSPNFYDLLGLSPSATADEIKHAYREQMRRFHPDNFAPEHARLEQAGLVTALHALEKEIAAANQQTQAINQAYETLSDAEKRAAYDLKIGQASASQSSSSNAAPVEARPTASQTVRTMQASEKHPASSSALMIFMLIYSLVFSLCFFSSQVPSKDNSQALLLRHAEIYRESTQTRRAILQNRYDQATLTALYTPIAVSPTMSPTALASATRIQPTASPTIRPTSTLSPTPPNFSEQHQAIERLLLAENYAEALQRLDVLLQNYPNDVHFYFQQASAYVGQYRQGDDVAAIYALNAFNRVTELNPNYLPSYRERGLLRFALWQRTGNGADLALADLLYYQESSARDAEVEAALERLKQ